MRHGAFLARVLGVVVLAQLALSGSAWAGRRDGSDPASNFRASPLPATCRSAPSGAKCVNAAVYYLDQARARLHQGPYRLPANFARLAPGRQILILTNLDRGLYHLAPIGGLTDSLSRVAMGGQTGDPGVIGDGDPVLSAPGVQMTSNWAGGFPNIVLAYEAWMYDDGPGSSNLDCTGADHNGCWGHRHDILTRFLAPGASALGVAAGTDSKGTRGYAMLIAKGNSSYTKGYSYRWAQAVADGAGRHNYVVGRPDTRTVQIGHLSFQGTTMLIPIHAPKGISTACSLSRRVGRRWSAAPFRRCANVARYPGMRPGKYRLRVRSSLGLVSETLTIRAG